MTLDPQVLADHPLPWRLHKIEGFSIWALTDAEGRTVATSGTRALLELLAALSEASGGQ